MEQEGREGRPHRDRHRGRDREHGNRDRKGPRDSKDRHRSKEKLSRPEPVVAQEGAAPMEPKAKPEVREHRNEHRRPDRPHREPREPRDSRDARDARHPKHRGDRPSRPIPADAARVNPAELPSPITGNPVIYDMKTGRPKNRSDEEFRKSVREYESHLKSNEVKFSGKKKAAPAIIKKISSKVTALFGSRGK